MAYKSKFNGVEIDALLEKVQNGQVEGGGGSSEKEELAKEIGATHKHTITLSMSLPEDNAAMKVRCVTYTADQTPFTVDSMTSLMAQGFLYFNGYYVVSIGGTIASGDAMFVLGGSEENAELMMITGRLLTAYNYVESVDFSSQSATTQSFLTLMNQQLPVQELLGQGYVFTDTVTEL